MSDHPALLDFEAAAKYLGIPEQTLRWLVKQGMLPTVKLGNQLRSRLRFRVTDLDAFIDASTTPARTGPLAK